MNNQLIDIQAEEESMNGGKKTAMILGGIVYGGVIIVAVLLTSMFITGILDADAYLLRALMTVGVVAIGINAIALPLALHFWAVEGAHRGAAITFYALDMCVIGLNIITSFSTLRGDAPAWVEQYAPYSVGMFVFALVTWGILYMLDPGARAKLELRKAHERFSLNAFKQATSYLDSAEGHAEIAKAAGYLIPQLFDAERMRNVPKSWNGNAADVAEAQPDETPFSGNGKRK